ncbi:MAG: hypothetical protein C4562_05215 [Actinobacteria bacterium]|nr:MAG: hypothetical protein C4562_05215 [Actinomycetota bacterium]
MLKAIIDSAKCEQAAKCINKCVASLGCKTKAIFKVDPDEDAIIDTSKCNGCSLCLPLCPTRAIRVIEL